MENTRELKDLSAINFNEIESIVNHEVTIHHPQGVIDAVVKGIRPLKKMEGAPGREQPFAIIFECGDHVTPQQASVMIRHEKFEMQNVFITPTMKSEEDKDKKNIYFEAVFG